jgi:hypothetical protein
MMTITAAKLTTTLPLLLLSSFTRLMIA